MTIPFLLMNLACLDWIICIYIFWLPCLEEFFEEQTGRECTGRMYAITRVLPLCCRSSLPTKLEFNVLHCLKYRGMPPKKLTAKTTKSISLKGSIDCTVQSTEMAEEENQRQNYVKLGNLIDDPRKLESMTIKELRAVMKDAGLPVKGSKHDLLSTLRSYVNSKAPDMEEPSDTEVSEHKDKPRKRKAGVSSSGEPSSVSDTIERKERSRGKSQSSNSTRLSKTVKKEKSSVQSEVAGKKKSRSSEKTTLNIGISSEAVVSEPWTILMHKKPQPGWIPYNPIVLRPPPLVNGIKFVKLMSWNVNGLRALLKSNGFSLLHQKENFDVLCLQETKMQEKDIDAIKERLIDGYDNSYWTCSTTKLGYSGTAIISRIKPISVRYGLGIEHHDGEGRLITAEFENFYLLSAYVPNSGDGLRRLPYRIGEWDPSLGNYMKDLEKSKPVVLAGDLNCAHEEMDIYDPAGNRRSAGFTNEERESFQKNFLVRGFVDTFRKQHPSVVGYTYYGYRHGGRKTNKGWRLDYFLVSESIANQVHDSYIVPEIGGSDHCPIGVILKI